MVHAPVTDPCNHRQRGHVLFTCKAKPRAIASNKEPVDTTFYRKYLGNSDFRAISVKYTKFSSECMYLFWIAKAAFLEIYYEVSSRTLSTGSE